MADEEEEREQVKELTMKVNDAYPLTSMAWISYSQLDRVYDLFK